MPAIASKNKPAPESTEKRKIKKTSVSEFIKARRNELGLSQDVVATRTGKGSPEWVGMIESGARELQLETAPKLADALQLDRQDFCKAVLKQYYPTVYSALYPKEAQASLKEKIAEIGDAKGTEQYIAQAAMDLYEKIHSLPKDSRITMMNMIDQVYNMHVTNNRSAIR